MKSILAFIFLLSTNILYSESGKSLFDNSYVHDIRIEIDTANWWNILDLNHQYDLDMTYSNNDSVQQYLPAFISIDGNILNPVGIRIKGTSSYSENIKKPFMIDINKYFPDQEYEGMKRINLLNSFNDHSYMRNMLSYNIFNFAGVDAPRLSYAQVFINDELFGLYEVVEYIGKPFLKDRFGSSKGNLYKGHSGGFNCYDNSDSCVFRNFDLKTNEDENNVSDMSKLLETLNQHETPNDVFNKQISEIFDIERYIQASAIDIVLTNWDSYNLGASKNYFIYSDPICKQFKWIPWDYNYAFSSQNNFNLLDISHYGAGFFIRTPELLERYIDAVKDVMAYNFTEERLFPVIDSTEHLLSEAISIDPNLHFTPELWHSALEKNTTGRYFERLRSTLLLSDYYDWGYDSLSTEEIIKRGYRLDTVFQNADSLVFITTYSTSDNGSKTYSGLKSFISNRIDKIKQDIQDLTLSANPDQFDALIRGNEIVPYPNPAENFVIVSGIKKEHEYTISLYDFMGKVIYSQQNNNIVNVENLPAGMFTIKYESGQIQQMTKFLKY